MNVRFEYLYRDAGNFKNWGELVFSNPHNINVDRVKSIAANVLIDQACNPVTHVLKAIEVFKRFGRGYKPRPASEVNHEYLCID